MAAAASETPPKAFFPRGSHIMLRLRLLSSVNILQLIDLTHS
jgi:hypothetical protein